MFLTWNWHLDLDLDMVRNLGWVFPEVLTTLRSVEAQIQRVQLRTRVRSVLNYHFWGLVWVRSGLGLGRVWVLS